MTASETRTGENRGGTIRTSEAARRAEVNIRTIQNWCRRASVGGRPFGRKIGGRWNGDLDRHLAGEELDFGGVGVIGGRDDRTS